MDLSYRPSAALMAINQAMINAGQQSGMTPPPPQINPTGFPNSHVPIAAPADASAIDLTGDSDGEEPPRAIQPATAILQPTTMAFPRAHERQQRPPAVLASGPAPHAQQFNPVMGYLNAAQKMPGHHMANHPYGVGVVGMPPLPPPVPAYVGQRPRLVGIPTRPQPPWQQEAHSSSVNSDVKRPRYENPAPWFRPVVEFKISSSDEVCAKLKGNIPDPVKTLFRLTEGARYEKPKRRWFFPLNSYANLHTALYNHQQRRDPPEFNVEPIPREILNKVSIHQNKTKAEKESEEELDRNLKEKIPAKLVDSLALFQKEGVTFVLKRGGRGLIADEMGLGKTIQAIAVACAYRDEWPVLVIAPSTARYHWEKEFLRWLENATLRPEQILVITNSSQVFTPDHRIVIVSYDIAQKLGEALLQARFQVVIADECHYLKNHKARRTKSILPILKKATRAVLLSGTPAISRPRELFTQLSTLDPKFFGNQHRFMERYCHGGKKKQSGRNKSNGASNLLELNALMKATVMVRRKKKDILKNLPAKKRVRLRVDVQNEKERAEIAEGMKQLCMKEALLGRLGRKKAGKNKDDNAEGQGAQESWIPKISSEEEEQLTMKLELDGLGGLDRAALQNQKKSLLMNLFCRTGHAKIQPAIDRLKEVLSDDLGGKVLVFAHHRAVMDGIEEGALKDVPHIRIDGSTASKQRQNLVDIFQTDPACRVALLSLTAAGVSITLTAATRAIFVELFWTPAALLQAEDRCHRIGQTSEVTIEYLIAEGTLDDGLWPLIRHKMRVLGEIVEGEKGNLEVQRDEKQSGPSDVKKEEEGSSLALSSDEMLMKELAKEDVDKIVNDGEEGDGDDDQFFSDDEEASSANEESEEDNDVNEVYSIGSDDEEEPPMPTYPRKHAKHPEILTIDS